MAEFYKKKWYAIITIVVDLKTNCKYKMSINLDRISILAVLVVKLLTEREHS